MNQNVASQPLRQGRIWLDFGKLVLAAVVQGVVVSAIVAVVVMILASGPVPDTNPSDAPVTGAPARSAGVDRGEG